MANAKCTAMIGFGELRRISLEWQTDLNVVERSYALDWLLNGIFNLAELSSQLALTGSSALSKAYWLEYPTAQAADVVSREAVNAASLEPLLTRAAQGGSDVSGVKFRLHSVSGNEARFEFAGPLGRRSAAQPLLPLRVYPASPRIEPIERQLIHPFSDQCLATVRAVSLDELAAERLVLFSQKPRARDVYDLWFILTRAGAELDAARTQELARQIAREKRVTLRTELDPLYAPLLERAWDNALKDLRPRINFNETRTRIQDRILEILAADR